MKNIQITLEEDILEVKVNLSKEFGPSSSGKTIIIASHEGNVSVPDSGDKMIGEMFTGRSDKRAPEK